MMSAMSLRRGTFVMGGTLRLCVTSLAWAAALCVFASLRDIFGVGSSTLRLYVFA